MAVWIAPVGLAATALGVVSLRGTRLPRWVLVLLAAVVVALLILGQATWIYASAHPPTSA